MRLFVAVLAAIVAIAGAAIQFTSDAFYADLAHAPAIPQLVPLAFGEKLARSLARPGVPASIRAAYARALLHRGALAPAAAIVMTLPDGLETFELRGELAERSGATAQAVAEYTRARDVEHAQRLIDTMAAAGQLEAALRYERELAAPRDRVTDEENRARALWRMGQITEEIAVRSPARAAMLERAALEHYLAALALAPSDETYLLGAAEELLVIGDPLRAAALYQRAAAAVPNSVDAYVGLARAAAAQHACAAARADLARARALQPTVSPPDLGACAVSP